MSLAHRLPDSGRVDWVDAAKGICIILVVMMHTTLGLEKASGETGWMHAVVAFAQPFRIPDFFLISGLFLSLTIDRPWRLYLDRKVLHFFYFYVLWMAIQFAFKGGFAVMDGESVSSVLRSFAFAFVQPFGTLWFIYLLPVFFVVTKLFRSRPYWLLAIAVVLEILPINTQGISQALGGVFGVTEVHHGWVLIDEFCARLVYFVAGYLFATRLFDLADWARANVMSTLVLLVCWGVVNGALVQFGWSGLPLVSLALGSAGAVAIIVFAALVSRLVAFAPLVHAGANSIVVYLAFFLPMVVSRLLFLKFAPWLDAGTMAALCTLIGVATPLIGYAIIKRIGLGMFLFHRPNWAILPGTPWRRPTGPKASLQPAE
ncbi:MAG: acyltransferase family protein [Ahrensia sp.]|nr:acyltransferase family protein [Ahrensia sp.]